MTEDGLGLVSHLYKKWANTKLILLILYCLCKGQKLEELYTP